MHEACQLFAIHEFDPETGKNNFVISKNYNPGCNFYNLGCSFRFSRVEFHIAVFGFTASAAPGRRARLLGHSTGM